MPYFDPELIAEEQQKRRRHIEAAWLYRSTVDRTTCDFTRQACDQHEGCCHCPVAWDRAAQEKAQKP